MSTLLKQMGDELAAEVSELEQQMYSMAGYEFNASSPAQLSEVLFTKLQLPTAGIKKGKTGYSTGQKELDKLRGQHPIIELIERYRELTKLISTYIEALPKLMATGWANSHYIQSGCNQHGATEQYKSEFAKYSGAD